MLLEPGGTIYPDRELDETFFLPMGVQQISRLCRPRCRSGRP